MKRRAFLWSFAAAILPQSRYAAATNHGKDTVRIEFSRFSAFYTPLIVGLANRFFDDEGITPVYRVSQPGTQALASLQGQLVDVVQSAPGLTLLRLKKGIRQNVAHFAQVNERDGFFIVGRTADPSFSWDKLHGARVLLNFDAQPLSMFRYACFKKGIEFANIKAMPGGAEDAAVSAFLRGEADYIHLQGPAAQGLSVSGTGAVLASVGEAIGPVAFSTLASTPEWINSDVGRRFTRAYRRSQRWTMEHDPDVIARTEAAFFQGIDQGALVKAVMAYKEIRTWTAQPDISKSSYDVAVDVFQHAGLITNAAPYGDVVMAAPD